MAKRRATSDRDTLLAAASKHVQTRHKNVLSDRASEALELPSQWCSTGSLVLDRICSGRNPGGLPLGPRTGRVIHIPGVWSTGKSLILDHLFKYVIVQMGGIGLRSEAEGTADPHFAKAIGLPLEHVEIQQSETLEEMWDAGLTWHDKIRAAPGGATVPIIWGIDSLDATQTGRVANVDLSKSGGYHYGGGKSELLGVGLRKAVARCARFPTTLVMLNQTREDPNVQFGPDKNRSTGGNAPHFYASQEIFLSLSPLGVKRGEYKGSPMSDTVRKRLGFAKEDRGDVIGRWVRARIAKTKVAPTLFQECDFYIDFRRGINPWSGLLQRFIREGRAGAKDDRSVTFKDQDGEVLAFPSERAWLDWMIQPEHFKTYVRTTIPVVEEAEA